MSICARSSTEILSAIARTAPSRWPRWAVRAAAGMALVAPLLGPLAHAGEFSDEFDRQRFKSAFAHEIAFREAALHVAWGAEPLCDDTNEIEPFVLWSVRTVRSGLSVYQQKLFKQATGMDEHWRVAWLDEGAPEELKLGQRVLSINKRLLPMPAGTIELTAVFRGGATLSVDDQAFWEVLHKAREEAGTDASMTLTLEGGREVKVSTQSGCAGTVTATAFDDEPQNFQRLDSRRSKIPGNALLEAQTQDERRWLAAFGTYFLASEGSILRQRSSDSTANAFLIGKVLALAVPGAGTLLSAVESQTQRTIQVDGLVGGADLFANEVVMAMGGDPSVGMKLSDRLKAKGIKADVVELTEFRRSNVELHLRKLREIEQARRLAEQAAEDAVLTAVPAAAAAASAPAAVPAPPAPPANTR